MAAFSLAPYPSSAGRPRSQLYFGLHPQGFAVSSASRATSALGHHRFDAVRSRFCARARALALHPLGMSVCPVVGGLSTPAIIGQRQPPFLSRWMKLCPARLIISSAEFLGIYLYKVDRASFNYIKIFARGDLIRIRMAFKLDYMYMMSPLLRFLSEQFVIRVLLKIRKCCF